MPELYVNDKPVLFVSSEDKEAVQVNGTGAGQKLAALLDQFEVNDIPLLKIGSEDPDLLWKELSNIYSPMEASGGLVLNNNGFLLMIYRFGRWDLPKGKIEKNESPREAALREVNEECGIGGLTILKECRSTYHTYHFKGEKILKRTYWFRMSTNDINALHPQHDEGIEIARWMNEEDISEALKNTYGSVAGLLRGEQLAR